MSAVHWGVPYIGPLAHLQGCTAAVRHGFGTEVFAQFDDPGFAKAPFTPTVYRDGIPLGLDWHRFTTADFKMPCPVCHDTGMDEDGNQCRVCKT